MGRADDLIKARDEGKQAARDDQKPEDNPYLYTKPLDKVLAEIWYNNYRFEKRVMKHEKSEEKCSLMGTSP